MIRIILFIVIVSCNSIFAQDGNYQSVQTAQTGGRFEIIQSNISEVYTFKLDKYSGAVYVYVKLPELEQPSWLKIEKTIEVNDTISQNKINYQLFLGGKSLTDCYLININSGTTWSLIKENNKHYFKGFDTSLD